MGLVQILSYVNSLAEAASTYKKELWRGLNCYHDLKNLFDIKNKLGYCIMASRLDNRGCKCRKTAGEESPGFIGQDAG